MKKFKYLFILLISFITFSCNLNGEKKDNKSNLRSMNLNSVNSYDDNITIPLITIDLTNDDLYLKSLVEARKKLLEHNFFTLLDPNEKNSAGEPFYLINDKIKSDFFVLVKAQKDICLVIRSRDLGVDGFLSTDNNKISHYYAFNDSEQNKFIKFKGIIYKAVHLEINSNIQTLGDAVRYNFISGERIYEAINAVANYNKSVTTDLKLFQEHLYYAIIPITEALKFSIYRTIAEALEVPSRPFQFDVDVVRDFNKYEWRNFSDQFYNGNKTMALYILSILLPKQS